MQTQDLLEKSKKLKSKAETLLQEMGESEEYWQARILESERWLLAKYIDDFQKNLMEQFEKACRTALNPNRVWLVAHEFETWDPAHPLKLVTLYDFYFRTVKDHKRELPAMYKVTKKENVKFLQVETLETVVRELKKEIMEGKKVNLLRSPVEKILYNSIPTTPPPDRTLHRKSPQKKGISQYGYKRIPEPENVYKRIQEPEKNSG